MRETCTETRNPGKAEVLHSQAGVGQSNPSRAEGSGVASATFFPLQASVSPPTECGGS